MSEDAENARLKQELDRLKQIHAAFFRIQPPSAPPNCPSGPPELIHGYKVGFANGWVAFRQQFKTALNPGSG